MDLPVPRSGRLSWLVVALPLLLTASLDPVTAHGDEPHAPRIVVTTEILGAIVAELAGDVAEVRVLMPPGVDPHAWEPSARDTEALLDADLVVANGLDLEGGLRAVLDVARADGIDVFEAADHVDLAAPAEATHEDEAGHDHDDAPDPHLWTDPLAVLDVVVALEARLGELGLDVSAQAAAQRAALEALDGEVRETLATVAPDDRVLVTGHRSMGYFAQRYGFELLGTVIPGLSTDGEPSARELSRLIADIREAGVPVVFAEVGTPDAVARAVADDGGARLVELSTSRLPADGTYAGFIRALAETVAGALTR